LGSGNDAGSQQMKANALARAPQPDRVLTEAVIRVARLLELNQAELARILGVSGASVSRLINRTRLIDPASKEGELALLLVRAYRSLDALVGGDKEQRLAWLRSNNRILNARPAELLKTITGLVNTVAYFESARVRL
jgi:DNA-binding CsgD family transcriptional regulator